jgi:Tol biopolymer transport system component
MPAYVNDSRVDAHLAVTPDGSRLFFYSHRRPTHGSVDIWETESDGAGGWTEPRNLGAPVNTAQIEFGAGLSGDGKTLFFSRDGRLMQVSLSAALAGLSASERGSTDAVRP